MFRKTLTSQLLGIDEHIEHTPAKIAWERKLTLRMKGPTENDANTQGTFDGEERALM